MALSAKRKITQGIVTVVVLATILALASAAQGQVPQINQPLVPATIAPESPGFNLTVNGTGFAPGSVVLWNRSGRATTFISNTRLTATITAADVDTPGTAWVTVISPLSPVLSNVAYFEITNPTTPLSFGKTDYAAGFGTRSVVTADVNGDGKLDLIVANQNSSDLDVLLGNGDGTFQPAVRYAVGCGPQSIAVGDFNGDGRLDVATANQCSNDVTVLIGNGDGTFQPAVSYAVGGDPHYVAVGDFNRDGKLDLVVANTNSFGVSVLLGNGDGTFGTAVSYSTGSGPWDVVVGDFNGDGKLDLAVANVLDRNVSVLLGNGDGTFQPAVNYGMGARPYWLTLGDFNGDGRLDLVVTFYEGSSVALLLGNGDGTFQSPVSYATGSAPAEPTVGDFNGDGKLDLAVPAQSSNVVNVLLGNGDGTFQAAVSYAAGSFPSVMAAGDFNGDGRVDLAVANFSSNNVSVLLQPTPAFGFAQLNGGNFFTGNQTVNGNVSASFFFGDGSGLTNLNPANLAAGTAGINITGTAGNASKLGGVAAGNYARLDIGNSFTGNQSVTGNVSASGNLSTAGTTTVGSGGTPIVTHLSATFNPSFPALKPSTCATANFTLTGASDGDTLALGVPNARTTGGGTVLYFAWVSAANTITIQACNVSASPQKTAGSGAIRVDLWKH